jgi:hypothetical protein
MFNEEELFYIFRPWITIKGQRIYRKNGGMFKIPVKELPDSRKQ